MNIAITKWNTQDAAGALEAGEEVMKILEPLGMCSSNVFLSAKQLVDQATQILAS